MDKRRWILVALLGLVGYAGGPAGLTAQAPGGASGLSHELAREAVDAAEAEARDGGWNVTIVVVDADGVPVVLRRLTGASAASYDFAMGKARTAAASGLPTQEYAEAVAQGRTSALPDAVTIEGGVPILLGGEVAGAIAVSGVPPQFDGQIARAGAAVLEGR